jgi:hypothetical protein
LTLVLKAQRVLRVAPTLLVLVQAELLVSLALKEILVLKVLLVQ